MNTVGRRAFTLLEVMLALALAAVVLGMLSMAVDIHLRVAEKGRDQVEQAQLARTLLERIADDLRNAVPYTAPKDSSDTTSPASTSSSTSPTAAPAGSGSTGGSASTGGPGSRGSPGSTEGTASTESDESSTVVMGDGMFVGGLLGTSRELKLEISRQPRSDRPLVSAGSEAAAAGPQSDLRTVAYSVVGSDSLETAETMNLFDEPAGLVRREMESAIYQLAQQQGQELLFDDTAEVLAPEVMDLQFTYFDSTTAYDEWDSSQQGGLPVAIKVAIYLYPVRGNSTVLSGLAATEDLPPPVYELLIRLPNAKVGQ